MAIPGARDARGRDDGRPQLTLEAGTHLIGDLHLDVEVDGAAERFLAFAAACDAPRLVILGDLFEYWVGDAQAATPGGRAVLVALRRLVDAGCPVDVIPGNRDFLLGARFEEASGARVRPRGFVGALPGGGRALVVHGDELCTLDRGYQRLRRVLRAAPLRWAAPRLPLVVSQAIARRLRRASRSALATKPPLEAEQQPDAVRSLAAAAGCDVLVCGHAHRWRDEQLAGGPRWLVLDAFGDGRDLLTVGRGGELDGRSSDEVAGSA